MSSKLVGRALEARGLSPVEKLVLIGLADCTNTMTGACFPSARWLSGVADVSERHVRRCIASLEEKGLIVVNRRDGRSSYFTVLPEGVTPDTMSPLTPDTLSATPDIAMSGTPDIAMSPEPEEPERIATIAHIGPGDNLPHHYCRALEKFVELPITECDCRTTTKKEKQI